MKAVFDEKIEWLHSPDLALCDFFLLLKRKSFGDMEEGKEKWKGRWNEALFMSFRTASKDRKRVYIERCLTSNGEYLRVTCHISHDVQGSLNKLMRRNSSFFWVPPCNIRAKKTSTAAHKSSKWKWRCLLKQDSLSLDIFLRKHADELTTKTNMKLTVKVHLPLVGKESVSTKKGSKVSDLVPQVWHSITFLWSP